jgi:hypothetical protein
MMALSFHTLQNKRPVSPQIIFEGKKIFNAKWKQSFQVYILIKYEVE